jgi:hypothetical protein
MTWTTLPVMATFDDVTTLTDELAGVSRGVRFGNGTWKIGDKVFAWQRPFSKADIKRFAGAPVPAVVADKEAVLAEGHDGVFTISHFDGYAALLIQLDNVGDDVLHDLVIDAWMVCAPTRDVDAYLARHPIE